jgi:hypothetical protein
MKCSTQIEQIEGLETTQDYRRRNKPPGFEKIPLYFIAAFGYSNARAGLCA